MEACACKYDSFTILIGFISEKNKQKLSNTSANLNSEKKGGKHKSPYAVRRATHFGKKILFHSIFSIVLNT